jgi:DNA-binding transcriptional ArsR family regulator
MDVTELLLHPVRLQIVHALAGGRELTVGELGELLTGASKVTIYRHVAALAAGDFIEVAAEQKVRGAVERRYRLRSDRPSVTVENAAAMSLDDHRRGFAAAMLVLLAEFENYLDRDGADPVADSVSYRQATVWLTDGELAELGDELQALFGSLARSEPGPGRRAYRLSPVFFPAPAPQQDASG